MDVHPPSHVVLEQSVPEPSSGVPLPQGLAPEAASEGPPVRTLQLPGQLLGQLLLSSQDRSQGTRQRQRTL